MLTGHIHQLLPGDYSHPLLFQVCVTITDFYTIKINDFYNEYPSKRLVRKTATGT